MGGLNWTRAAKARSIERYGTDVMYDVEAVRRRQKKAKKRRKSKRKASEGLSPELLAARVRELDRRTVAECGRRPRANGGEHRVTKPRVARSAVPPPVPRVYREGRLIAEVRNIQGAVRTIKVYPARARAGAR
jgi:hypothetical protein